MTTGKDNREGNWNEQLQSDEEFGPRMGDDIGCVQSGNAAIANEMEMDDSDIESELSQMSYSSNCSDDLPLSNLSAQNVVVFASPGGSDMDEDVDIEDRSTQLSSTSTLESVSIFESCGQNMADEQLESVEPISSDYEDDAELDNPESALEGNQGNLGANAQPAEANAASVSFDLSRIHSDWRTMWHVFLLYEQSSNELVRLLQLLQSVVRLFEQSEQQFLTPPPSPSAAGDAWTTNSWTFYRQQVDDLLRIARHFAQLIQMQMRGGFLE